MQIIQKKLDIVFEYSRNQRSWGKKNPNFTNRNYKKKDSAAVQKHHIITF